ncbi:hypothetical protein MSMAS_1786 [Methanosarcina mazei S-6]|jgi:hypothetical protein|uniref:Uncharacterized protein n=4 Tax=Methanosarcina mazei TaxID=2209 RepID=A0A0E3RKS2_METMZ|nr:hypothetical protein MSMAP_1680 [Methanosarcina mazei SarPi]AKB64982.1 hypothetical protein MSMAS_1786 [Methanosarcina mazei S-6]AKB67964.1 hypothetical protein MSMAL_1421 [Methanosarcina mazei LYC]
MSIVYQKPQLDTVLALPEATGQEIEQRNRNDNTFKISSCFKEFETADFETLNPKMKFSIHPAPHYISSNASTLSGKMCTVEESGLALLKTAKKIFLDFNQLTESYPVVTDRASELCSCPKTPENRN